MSSVEKIFEDLRLEADCNARRCSHSSLQDTNVCGNGKMDQCDSRVRVLKGSDPADWLADHNSAWNVTNNIKIGRSSTDEPNKVVTKNENNASEPEIECEDTSSDDANLYHTKDNEISSSRDSSLTNEPNKSQENVDENEESDAMAEIRNENSASESEVQCQDTSSHIEALHGERCPDDAYVRHTNNDEISYGRGGTQRKEADCAGITDMTIQMCRYLTHQDLKRKIIEFNKRENLFINKNSWDDALRLREMRNELILQKYKNLYENDDLEIDEETRAVGTKVINTIEMLNKERAKLCNSNLYSDDARELWKQWVREDNEIAETESNSMRDLRLEELEEEWNGLALCDKNRISQLYDRIMNKSNLQNEQKLEDKIEDANDRQKQYMNYLVT